MNARRRGRRLALPSSGRRGRTALPTSSLSGVGTSPSSSAKLSLHWLNWNDLSAISGSILPSNQASTTISASNPESEEAARWVKLFYKTQAYYEGPNWLVSYDIETPQVGVDRE